MYVLLGVLKARYGTQSPGPMVYGARTTFGPQAASKNRTAPVINFTKGLRERVPIHHLSMHPCKRTIYKYIYIFWANFHTMMTKKLGNFQFFNFKFKKKI